MADAMPPLPRHVRNPRPRIHDDPAIDRLIAMNLALAREISVLRDRVTTLEKLGEQAGWLAPGAVDGWQQTPDERKAREAAREGLVKRVFSIVEQEIEELERGAEQSGYWTAVEAIEGGDA
jgi:hypothetical protein